MSPRFPGPGGPITRADLPADVWYYRGVQANKPAVSAIFMNLPPLLGVAIATVVLRESVKARRGWVPAPSSPAWG